VLLREGTATYGVPPNVQQIVVQAGQQGQKLQSGWRVAPGSILRVSAVIGDSLDDPLGFLAPDRISLTVSKIQGATISLVTQTAVISLTNAAVPFNVELPPAERLDTTLGFGFIVAVTDVLGNVKIEDAIGSFDVDGRPIIEGLASTDNGRLVDQAANDGASVAINADEILTLALTATDFGTVTDLDVVQTPDPAVGSSVSVAKSAMDQTTVTATVTVTPDVPTYGIGPSDALNLKATATDDTALTIVQDEGVTVDVNDLSLFSPLFDGMIDTTAITLTSDDIGRLSAAGADVREVTIGEGTKLTVTIEARDMTAADAVTLEVTGTAISSAATIAGATLNGVGVLDAAASPTVAIVESGSIEFVFEPGYKAVPYGSASDVATFTLRAWVADDAQIALGTQKDYVDLIVNVTSEVTTPVVTVTDVELVNAGGATSVSLGSVAAANVQETSKAIVKVSAVDQGGEPVTVTFANSSTIADVRDNGTPTAGAATTGSISLTPGLFDADTGVGLGLVDSPNDPMTITATGTNASGLSNTAQVNLDLLNLAQPPQITIASTQGGADLGTSMSVRPEQVSQVMLYITALDSDGELVIVDVDGTPLNNAVTIKGKSTGTYTFTVPQDLIENTNYPLTVTATDGGFQQTVRVFTIKVQVGNQAPVLTLDPTEVTIQVGESVFITAEATDDDGDDVTFTISPEGAAVQGTPVKVGNTTTVDFTFAGTAEGVTALEITATDPAGAFDTETATITVTPVVVAAEPDQMILSHGWGGNTSSKRLAMNEAGQWRFAENSGFQGMTKVFAENIINSTRARAVRTAVGDIDNNGSPDIVTAFGPGGQVGDDGNPTTQPSVVVVWRQSALVKPTKITTKGVFNKDAAAAALRNPDGDVNVAVGNFVGEDVPMLACAQGIGGSNWIRIFQYGFDADAGRNALIQVGEIKAWKAAEGADNPALWGSSGGLTVAAGDVDGDGLDELVVGQTKGVVNEFGYGPETYVQVLDLKMDGDEVVVDTFTASTKTLPTKPGLGGVNVAVGDLRGDGKDLIIVASAGNPDGTTKNHIRVWEVVDGALTSVTGPLVALGADQNPSGALSIAAGNLDEIAGDELLVGTQALISVDENGIVSFSNMPPSNKAKGIKVNFDASGTYVGPLGTARIPFSPFGGAAVPSSNGVGVGMYPAP
ncbi:MAG: hypothetical protein ABIH23_11385, partial [bacterium]